MNELNPEKSFPTWGFVAIGIGVVGLSVGGYLLYTQQKRKNALSLVEPTRSNPAPAPRQRSISQVPTRQTSNRSTSSTQTTTRSSGITYEPDWSNPFSLTLHDEVLRYNPRWRPIDEGKALELAEKIWDAKADNWLFGDDNEAAVGEVFFELPDLASVSTLAKAFSKFTHGRRELQSYLDGFLKDYQYEENVTNYLKAKPKMKGF